MVETIKFEAEKVKVSVRPSSDFAVCTAYLMSDGVNRNRSEFTLESIKNSLDTFVNKPVLANIWTYNYGGEKKNYIGGHDFKVAKDESGKEYITYLNGERAVGVITDQSQISIQKYKGRNFVVAKLFLWKNYNPELIEILVKDKEKKVSVEVLPVETEKYINEEGQEITRYIKFNFCGVTILGHRKIGFGEVDEIREGIEGSHLVLEKENLEQYIAAYSEAFSKEQKIQSNAKKIDKFIRKNDILQLTAQDKRKIILEEISDSTNNKEVALAYSSYSNDNEVESKYRVNNKDYYFKGHFNCDGSFEIDNIKESGGFVASQNSYLSSLTNKKELKINEVNLVDDIDYYDINQLIYKIFTYSNAEEIVKMTFGIINEQWQKNPYENLSFPFALIENNSITFSKNRIKQLGRERMRELYEYIRAFPDFQQVSEMLKEILAEKFEQEVANGMGMEEEKVLENNVKAHEENIEQKEEIVANEEAKVENNEKVKENCVETSEENCATPVVEDCGVKPETEDCGIKTQDDDDDDDKDEGEEGDKDEPNDDTIDDDVDDGESDKGIEKGKSEETKEAFEELKIRYADLTEQLVKAKEKVSALEKEVEAFKTNLQEANDKVKDLQSENFSMKVGFELSASSLEDSQKAEVLEMAKENKFAELIDAQKEIALREKQAHKDAFSFVSDIIGDKTTAKSNNVFDVLRSKNKWKN